MLAEFYLYNGNKLRVSSNGEFFLIEKHKGKEMKRQVQCNISDFFPYVQKVNINERIKQNNVELFNLIGENFNGYEVKNNIPVASMEKNSINLKNGYTFLGETSNDQIFGIGKNILNHFNPEGCNASTETDYLKFKTKDGIVLFIAQKPVKHSISWDSINGGSGHQDSTNVNSGVYGAMQRTINGETYKIRLLTGGNANPASSDGGEWNHLLVELNTHNSSIYNDIYFGTGSGNGRASWTQEQHSSNSSTRVVRGLYGVSLFFHYYSYYAISGSGWRPVLELVT
jgi:hypothetical protein